jgi:hypothetical protein
VRGVCSTYGEKLGVKRVLVAKPEGKRPLGIWCCKWGGNIKMYLQEVGCGITDCIELAQDTDRWRALVNVVMNLRVLKNAENILTSSERVSFSRSTPLHAFGQSARVARR